MNHYLSGRCPVAASKIFWEGSGLARRERHGALRARSRSPEFPGGDSTLPAHDVASSSSVDAHRTK